MSAANQSILRLFAVVTVVVLMLALFRLLLLVVPTFLMKYVSQNAYGRFAMGQAYGTAVASVIELTIMVSLTLWLARRRCWPRLERMKVFVALGSNLGKSEIKNPQSTIVNRWWRLGGEFPGWGGFDSKRRRLKSALR